MRAVTPGRVTGGNPILDRGNKISVNDPVFSGTPTGYPVTPSGERTLRGRQTLPAPNRSSPPFSTQCPSHAGIFCWHLGHICSSTAGRLVPGFILRNGPVRGWEGLFRTCCSSCSSCCNFAGYMGGGGLWGHKGVLRCVPRSDRKPSTFVAVPTVNSSQLPWSEFATTCLPSKGYHISVWGGLGAEEIQNIQMAAQLPLPTPGDFRPDSWVHSHTNPANTCT